MTQTNVLGHALHHFREWRVVGNGWASEPMQEEEAKAEALAHRKEGRACRIEDREVSLVAESWISYGDYSL